MKVVLPFCLDVVVPRPPVSDHVRLLIKEDDNSIHNRKFPPNFTPFEYNGRKSELKHSLWKEMQLPSTLLIFTTDYNT